MKKLVVSTLVGGLCLVGASSVEAAAVWGDFTIAGAEDVRVGGDYVDFGVVPDVWGTPIGDIDFITGTGTFDGIQGTEGTILDLIALPVDTDISVEDFIEIDDPQWSGLDFTLTRLDSGVGTIPPCAPPPASGDLCTPPGSPFSLLNTSPTSFSVSLRLSGYVTNELGEVSWFTGDFTSQKTDMSLEDALAAIEDENVGYVQSSWSADFAFTPQQVPEPASMLLMSLSLTGMAMAIRRRRR